MSLFLLTFLFLALTVWIGAAVFSSVASVPEPAGSAPAGVSFSP